MVFIWLYFPGQTALPAFNTVVPLALTALTSLPRAGSQFSRLGLSPAENRWCLRK